MNSQSKSSPTILLLCCLASFLTPFMGSSINLALPAISKDLGLDSLMLSWVVTAYTLSAAMFLVPFGRLADIRGKERIFKIGLILYAVFSGAAASAQNGLWLNMARFAQGIGGAMIFGTSTAILISAYPPEKRGRVLGIAVGVVYLGSSLGPVLGGFLTHAFGWRSIFFANVLVSLPGIVLSQLSMKNNEPEQKGATFDVPGSLVYGLSLVLLMTGFSVLPALPGIILLILGVFSLGFFAVLMTKLKSPVLGISVFKSNPVFIYSNIAALINYSSTFAVGFLMSLYLQFIKGYSAQHAGLIMLMQPVIMAICAPLAGRMSDKIEPRILACAGMICTTLGLLGLTFLTMTTPLMFIIPYLALIGLGVSLFSSPNTNAAMSSVEKKYYSVASATVGTMRLVGMMLSMGAITMIFSLVMGRTKITPEYFPVFLTSAKTGFAVFAGLCFIGIFPSCARGKVRGQS